MFEFGIVMGIIVIVSILITIWIIFLILWGLNTAKFSRLQWEKNKESIYEHFRIGHLVVNSFKNTFITKPWNKETRVLQKLMKRYAIGFLVPLAILLLLLMIVLSTQ